MRRLMVGTRTFWQMLR